MTVNLNGFLLSTIVLWMGIYVCRASTAVQRNISESTVWTEAGNPYITHGDVTVQKGAILTLKPGVIVRLGKNHEFIIRGVLAAEGTERKEVVFTAIADKPIPLKKRYPLPLPGDWKALSFLGERPSRLYHCWIKYARHGLHFRSADSTEVIGCAFTRCEFPLWVEGAHFPLIDNPVFEDNVIAGLLMTGSTNGNCALPSPRKLKVPLLVDERDFTISANDTLTAPAGTVFKGLSPSANLNIRMGGFGLFKGKPENPVVFTSIHDVSTGGNTGDGKPRPGDWGGLKIYGGHVLLENCWIQYATYGIHSLLNSSPEISSSVLTHCQYPVRVDGCSFPILTGNHYAGNKFKGIHLAGHTAASAHVPSSLKTGLPYLISEKGFLVHSGDSLFVPAGTVIKGMSPKAELFLAPASYVAFRGSEKHPVILTAANDNSAGGITSERGMTSSWGGIVAHGGSLVLSDCEIRNARFGISANKNSRPAIRKTHFSGCGFPMRVNGSSLFESFSENTFSGNIMEGILLRGQTSGNITLPGMAETGLPYILTDKNFHVLEGDTAIILPGAVFKFGSPNTAFEVAKQGYADFQGTRENPIVLTSLHDNSVGGNTGSGKPAPGDWGGVTLAGQGARFLHCRIKYAGNGLFLHNGSNPVVRCCSLSQCRYPMALSGLSEPLLDNVVFKNNRHAAIRLTGSANFSGKLPDLRPFGIPFLIEESGFEVMPRTKIAVPAGTVMKFQSRMSVFKIDSGATVNFWGYSDSPVILTSIHDNSAGGKTGHGYPLPGDWQGVRIDGGKVSMNACRIRYARYGVQASSNAVWELNSSLIAACRYPIYLNGGSAFFFVNNRYRDNMNAGILLAGVTTGSFTLPSSHTTGLPYLMPGRLLVSTGDTVSLSPGFEFHVRSDTGGFFTAAGGLLDIRGTLANPVIMEKPRFPLGDQLEVLFDRLHLRSRNHKFWQPGENPIRGQIFFPDTMETPADSAVP